MSLHFPYYVNYWIILAVLVYFTIVFLSKFLGNNINLLLKEGSSGSKVSPCMDDSEPYREGGIPSPSLRHRKSLSRMHRGYTF